MNHKMMMRRRLMTAGGTKFEDVKATFSVSGGMEDTSVTVDGVNYRLLKITKSGTLTFDKKANVSICLVGGGGNGASGDYGGGGGGGGGYMTHVLDIGKVQSLTFSIGAATQATTVSGDVSGTANGGSSGSKKNGGNGGSGGGAARSSSYYAPSIGSPGTGDGKSKYPFGITSLLAHCAGGGAGTYYSYANLIETGESTDLFRGGFGGSNGGNGTLINSYNSDGGLGGTYGGGNGGKAGVESTSGLYKGQNATFYGSGGGGGSFSSEYDAYNDWTVASAGGSGYQGVAYVISADFPASV